jgi:hypothetical protein
MPEPHRSDDDWAVDPGRPLPLRLLALLGAFSFVMLGLSSVLLPLMQRPPAGQPEASTPHTG